MRSVGLRFGRDQSSWPRLWELLCRNLELYKYNHIGRMLVLLNRVYVIIIELMCITDNVIQELDTRLSNEHERLIAAQYLIPFYLNDLSQEKIDSLTEYFEKFLTYEDKKNLLTDVTKWK